MDFIEVSLWLNGREDCMRIVICDNEKDAKELFAELTDALKDILSGEDDTA